MVLKTFAKKYLSSYTLPKSALNTRFCHRHTKSRSCRYAADLLFCAPDTRNLAAYAAGSSVPSVGRPGRSQAHFRCSDFRDFAWQKGSTGAFLSPLTGSGALNKKDHAAMRQTCFFARPTLGTSPLMRLVRVSRM